MTARLITLTLTWHCTEPGCDAHGTTDAETARHVKASKHGTVTVGKPAPFGFDEAEEQELLAALLPTNPEAAPRRPTHRPRHGTSTVGTP